MSFLLDTNVISEPTKKQPDAGVLRWFDAQAAETLFVSVLTLGELCRGILLLNEGKRRQALLRWIEGELEPAFAGRALGVDAGVMRQWAELQTQCARRGRTLSVMDGLIAATALAHGLTLVTRNTADFPIPDSILINPWIK